MFGQMGSDTAPGGCSSGPVAFVDWLPALSDMYWRTLHVFSLLIASQGQITLYCLVVAIGLVFES